MSNWNQIRRGNRGLGRKRSNSNFKGFINNNRFEPGQEDQLIIPIFDIDGVVGPFLKSFSVHRSLKRNNLLEFTGPKGGAFKPFTVRTSHPYGQMEYKDQIKVAEEGIICPLSEFAFLQEHGLWEAVNAKFGEDRKEFSDAEKKEVVSFIKEYKQEHFYVDQSYYRNEDGDNVPNLENYILVMRLETEAREETNSLGVKHKVYEVVKDENGLPKYILEFLKVSTKRMNDIVKAVHEAVFEDELLSEDKLHPYKDFEGTEDEVTNIFGWVQLAFNYPEGDRMESARNLNIKAVKDSKSVVTDELIEDFNKTAKETYERAEKAFYRQNSTMKLFTRDEILDALTPAAFEEWNRLKTEYSEAAEDWEERLNDILAEILERNNKQGESQPKEEDAEEVESVEEPKQAPKKKAKKAEPKAEPKEEPSQEVANENQTVLDNLLSDLNI